MSSLSGWPQPLRKQRVGFGSTIYAIPPTRPTFVRFAEFCCIECKRLYRCLCMTDVVGRSKKCPTGATPSVNNERDRCGDGQCIFQFRRYDRSFAIVDCGSTGGRLYCDCRTERKVRPARGYGRRLGRQWPTGGDRIRQQAKRENRGVLTRGVGAQAKYDDRLRESRHRSATVVAISSRSVSRHNAASISALPAGSNSPAMILSVLGSSITA